MWTCWRIFISKLLEGEEGGEGGGEEGIWRRGRGVGRIRVIDLRRL